MVWPWSLFEGPTRTHDFPSIGPNVEGPHNIRRKKIEGGQKDFSETLQVEDHRLEG